MTFKCQFYITSLTVILIFVSSYCIYVIAFCVYVISDLLTSILYASFYNILFFMFIWCYLSVVLTPPAKVPLKYRLTSEEVENYNRADKLHRNNLLTSIVAKKNLVLHNIRSATGYIRYCTICKVIKPDRAHHCTSCGICVLRMDHHCGWINNCVGFTNEKNFILMLFYCSMYCIFFSSTTVEYFILYTETKDKRYLPVVVGFMITICIGLLSVVLLFFNCWLLSTNETLLEKIHKLHFTQENTSFNLGCCNNFRQIFGDDWRKWLFPIFSATGNGAVFPVVVKL